MKKGFVMIEQLPEWAIAEIKSRKGEEWRSIRRDIEDRLGWKVPAWMMYDVLNDISDSDKIAACGKLKIYKNFTKGYQFCGGHCPCKMTAFMETRKATNMARYGMEEPMGHPDVRRKIKNTLLERYGVESVLASKSIREKINKTNEERYGGHHFANDAIKAKIRTTNLERYGVEQAGSCKEIRDKAKKTILDRYGSEEIFAVKEIREKSIATKKLRYGDEYGKTIIEKTKKTNLERYGVESVFSRPETRDKIVKTNLERFGVDNPMKNAEVVNKVISTNMLKYGVSTTLLDPTTIEKIKKTTLQRYGVENILMSGPKRDSIVTKWQADYNGMMPIQKHMLLSLPILKNKNLLKEEVSVSSVYSLAYDWGVSATTIYKYWNRHDLPKFQSTYENEIDHYISSLGFTCIRNDRKVIGGRELDFYIPEKNIAIEFNGIYWHSDVFKDTSYHENKWESCANLGIDLIMINEDEWLQRKEAIKIHIRNKLFSEDSEFKVTDIETTVAIDFSQTYTLTELRDEASMAYGAYINSSLAAVMLVSGDEVVNFASCSNITIGKMLSEVSKVHEGDLFYEIDLRYFAPSDMADADYVSNIAPRYRIVEGIKTRMPYEGDDGKLKIYDCGHMRFLKSHKL